MLPLRVCLRAVLIDAGTFRVKQAGAYAEIIGIKPPVVYIINLFRQIISPSCYFPSMDLLSPIPGGLLRRPPILSMLPDVNGVCQCNKYLKKVC